MKSLGCRILHERILGSPKTIQYSSLLLPSSERLEVGLIVQGVGGRRTWKLWELHLTYQVSLVGAAARATKVVIHSAAQEFQ
jgi:hypothetical protein